MVQIYKAKKKIQSTGQIVSVDITRLDNNGVGVGHYKNKPVFIEGALPQETVKAKIFEEKSKFSKAKLSQIEVPSKHRVDAQCRHFKQCGGCDIQHLAYDAQLEFKQQKVVELFARNNVKNKLPWQKPISLASWQYRRKARIGVQYNKKGEVFVGFRSKASNNVFNVDNCPVLEASLSDISSKIKAVMSQMPRIMSIGHIEVISTSTVSLVLRVLKPFNSKEKALWLKAAETHQWQLFIDDGDDVKSLSECEFPSNALNYELYDGKTITFSPSDFIQVNHAVNNKMVEQAMNWLSLEAGDELLDLFCGLGNFSLPVAEHVKKVVGVEGVQAMVDRASKNAELNGINNCEFFQADLNSRWKNLAWQKAAFNKIILDPARAGALEVVQQISQFKASTILYVSCEPTSLARDVCELISQGYKISKIGLIDMFSQTKHIETMVLFTRN